MFVEEVPSFGSVWPLLPAVKLVVFSSVPGMLSFLGFHDELVIMYHLLSV